MKKLDQLALEMMEFYRGEAKQIQHFTKVYAYANLIARMEKLDEQTRQIIAATALMHDIGIKPAKEKYGRGDGPLQEKEGPPVAAAMLEKLGFSAEFSTRVCHIIGHHHTYVGIDGVDYQIIVEADFLVNIQEGNEPESAIPAIYQNIFRTEAGKEIFCKLYNYHPGEA